MKEYEFTLKFSLNGESMEADTYLEALEREGCDDAIIGIAQNGRIALQFNREAHSALQAVISAIKNVEKAIPTAKLIEATPDLVGVTDIAQTLSLSRQYMRKLMLSNKDSFPAPIHEGKASLWHLSTVLAWLKKEDRYSINGALLDVAEANMQLNFYKESSNFTSSIQTQLAEISKENLTSCVNGS